jgi:hypothetical protein
MADADCPDGLCMVMIHIRRTARFAENLERFALVSCQRISPVIHECSIAPFTKL